MIQVDERLIEAVKTQPEEIFQLIVRVEGDLDERQGQLETEGFVITRRLRLIRGFAANAKGATVSKALEETWIISLEFDQEVHTMEQGDSGSEPDSNSE